MEALLISILGIVLNLVFAVGFWVGSSSATKHFERYLAIYENGLWGIENTRYPPPGFLSFEEYEDYLDDAVLDD